MNETNKKRYILEFVCRRVAECGVLLGLEVEIGVENLHELFLVRHSIARKLRPYLNI